MITNFLCKRLPPSYMHHTTEPTLLINRNDILNMRYELMDKFNEENVGAMKVLNKMLHRLERV